MTRDIPSLEDPEYEIPSFVVPKYWLHDYVIAITFMLLIHTETNIDTVSATLLLI